VNARDASTPRKRLPREELRRRVLDAASTMLESGALSVGLQHLNLEELIRLTGVPRSSVFAAFGTKDELITELMLRALREPGAPIGFSPATRETVLELLAEYGDRLYREDGTPDPEWQDAVLDEVIRRAIQVNVADVDGSLAWHTYWGLAVSAHTLPPERREPVVQALREAHDRLLDGLAEIYAEALPLLGRRPVAGLTLRNVAAAGAAVIEGVASRLQTGSDAAEAVVMRPGIDGEPVPWPLVALAYRAVIRSLTERA